MIITKMALPRRTFLRGLGTTLSLPLLDAMFPAMSVLAANPRSKVRRLGYVYIPMGMNAAQWTPPGEGRITELSPSLASLAPHLDHVTVLTNTELKRAYGPGNHATGNAAFLSTCSQRRPRAATTSSRTTCDQIAAQAIGKETAIPSLELGTDLIAQVGNCDNGLACVYMNSLSWSSPTTPLPSGGGSARAVRAIVRRRRHAEQRQRRAAQKRQHARCGNRGDGADFSGSWGRRSHKVNQYLDTVREVERRIQKAEQQSLGRRDA